jgi:hypothetical protein
MDDHEVSGVDLEKAHDRSDGLSAQIHEGLGFEQNDGDTRDGSLGEEGIEFLPSEAELVEEGKPVGNHEPEVMAAKEVSVTRISETGDDFHNSLRVGKRRMAQGKKT